MSELKYGLLRHTGGGEIHFSVTKRRLIGEGTVIWEIHMPHVGTDKRQAQLIVDALNLFEGGSMNKSNQLLERLTELFNQPHNYEPGTDTVGICLCRQPSSNPVHNV